MERCAILIGSLLGLLAMVGCSGSSDSGKSTAAGGAAAGAGGSNASGSGGQASSAGSGASPTSGASCSGLVRSVRVSELTSDQVVAACHGYAVCDAQPLVDDPIPAYCRSMAIVMTGMGGASDYATNADAQADCQTSYDECAADSTSAAKAAQLVTTMLARNCPSAPSPCTATIGELDVCYAGMKARGNTLVPTKCSEVTLDWIINGTAEGSVTVAGCETINDPSCLQLANGVN